MDIRLKNNSDFYLSLPYTKSIDKALIEVLIDLRAFPNDAIYKGKPVYASNLAKTKLQRGFVYFVRNQDIYKIGITDNLLRRINELKPDEIINVVRCQNYEILEKELHQKFKSSRIPQTEYFRLSPNQVETVHKLMTTKANF